MLKQRVITALILLIVVSALLFAAPYGVWLGFVSLLVAVAAYEWSKLFDASQKNALIYAGVAGVFFAGVAVPFFNQKFTETLYLSPTLSLFRGAEPWNQFPIVLSVASLLFVFWWLVVPVWLFQKWQLKNRIMAWLLGIWVIFPCAYMMIFVREVFSPLHLLLLMGVVWIADIGAYFCGKKWGKHKLAPAISPGKTWEGAVGAMVCVALYAVTVCFMAYGNDLSKIVKYVIIALCLVPVSIYGDLFESHLKRGAGVKDSGSILPGHGGVLDRIDALLAVLAVMWSMIFLWV